MWPHTPVQHLHLTQLRVLESRVERRACMDADSDRELSEKHNNSIFSHSLPLLRSGWRRTSGAVQWRGLADARRLEAGQSGPAVGGLSPPWILIESVQYVSVGRAGRAGRAVV